MQSLNDIFIKAKENKVYNNLAEFEDILTMLKASDKDLNLDWDKGAGEEWAVFTKADIGYVCMMNTKIGAVFARNDYLSKEGIRILEMLYLTEVESFSIEDWFVDLEVLEESVPEINWHASISAVDTEKLSLNDLYFATI